MRRVPFAVVLFGLAFLAAPARSAPQKKDRPTKLTAQAAPLLDKAAEQTDLRAPGGLPFRMEARVRAFGGKRTPLEGTLKVVWVSPTEWREEIQWPDVLSSTVVTGDHIFEKNVDAHRREDFWVRQTLKLGRNVALSLGQEIVKWKSEKLDGVAADCYQMRGVLPPKAPVSMIPLRTREICLDPANGLPLERHDFFDGKTTRYSDYLPLGMRRFPSRLRAWYSTKPLTDIDVTSLEMIENPDPAAFMAPEGATSWDWCAAITPPRPVAFENKHSVGPPTWLWLPALAGRGILVVYFVVDITGHSRNFQLVDREGIDDAAAMHMGMIQNNVFEPASCGGKPIEYQVTLEVSNPFARLGFPF
jgi:hypothetical protein